MLELPLEVVILPELRNQNVYIHDTTITLLFLNDLLINPSFIFIMLELRFYCYANKILRQLLLYEMISIKLGFSLL